MPQTPLDPWEVPDVLAACDVVRVAFRDGDSVYLVPLGYVWRDAAMYGVSDPGKKIALASAEPMVTFQVDTSSASGLFSWRSVTGRGRFQIVDDPGERARVIASLEEFARNAPAWWREEQQSRVESGRLHAWRLTPVAVTGARAGPGPRP